MNFFCLYHYSLFVFDFVRNFDAAEKTLTHALSIAEEYYGTTVWCGFLVINSE